MGFQVLFEVFWSEGPRKRVGILPVGKTKHPHLEALLQQEVNPPKRGPNAGRVPVVQNGNLVGVAANQPDLVHGQGRARTGYRMRDAGLVQPQDVGVAFHQQTLVLPDDALAGLEQTVECFGFAVEVGLGAVDVLGRFGVGPQNAPTESQHPPALGENGEHHPAKKPVGPLAVFAGETQPHFLQVLGAVPLGQRGLVQGVAVFQVETKLEGF